MEIHVSEKIYENTCNVACIIKASEFIFKPKVITLGVDRECTLLLFLCYLKG